MRWACLRACRSEPQIPQASVLTSTCPAAGLGSGSVSTTISPFLKMAARKRNLPSGSSDCPQRYHGGLPDVTHHALAGIGLRDIGELALEGGGSGPAVQPFEFGRYRGQR